MSSHKYKNLDTWTNVMYDVYEEDKMHPGFEEDYVAVDVTCGLKSFSIYDICDKNQEITSERNAKEAEEREKKVRGIEQDSDILKKIKKYKIKQKVRQILVFQDVLFNESEWIRMNKRFVDELSKESVDSYNQHIKRFNNIWKIICLKIRNVQKKTHFFKNVKSLWAEGDVKIIRSRIGMKKAIFKCSKCSQWEDISLAFRRHCFKYAPPVCRGCHAFDTSKSKRK